MEKNFFSVSKIPFSITKKNKTKSARQIAKSHDILGISIVSPIITSDFFY